MYLKPASFLSLIEDFSSAVYLLIFYLIKLLGSCFGHRWLSFALFSIEDFLSLFLQFELEIVVAMLQPCQSALEEK